MVTLAELKRPCVQMEEGQTLLSKNAHMDSDKEKHFCSEENMIELYDPNLQYNI